jgi:hypothetical protein
LPQAAVFLSVESCRRLTISLATIAEDKIPKLIEHDGFWRETDFNDWYWLLGNGQLGYGDGDETTVIRSSIDPSGMPKIITYYFRQTFVVSYPTPLADLSMWLLRDDGGVVYLNGTEVFRSDSMPPAPFEIKYGTLATNYNGGAAPSDNTIDRTNLSSSFLVTGTNIVAVEIHQQAQSSSDLSFDFALTGNVRTAISPPIITRSPTNQTVMANLPGAYPGMPGAVPPSPGGSGRDDGDD